jgi:ABC-type branched-subunit amino acid transport system substrate-binding protein
MLSAACGSTVQARTTVTDPSLGGLSSGSSSGVPGTNQGGGSQGAATSGSRTGSGGASAGSSAASVGSEDGTLTGGSAGGTTKGESRPVSIGYSTVRDASTATGSLGFAGVSTGDMDAQMAAIAAYANSHGGLLGRKIVLVNHDTRFVDSANNPSVSTEAACRDWTEDHHVFAALDLVNLSYNSNAMATCLAKHRALLISTGDSDGSAASYAQPYGPFSADVINLERYLPGLVNRLVAKGFFSGWDTRVGGPGSAPVKIGLMHFDDAAGNRYADTLKKALAAHGMTVTSEVSFADGVQTSAQGGSSAGLTFRAAGITHVFDANLGFMETAASQQYYPRMSVDDYVNTPATLASQPGIAKVLHGAMGAGTAPAIEVPSPPDTTSSATLCKQIMRGAGLDFSNAYTLAVMLSECDSVFLLVAAVNRGGEVTPDGFRRGLEGLGQSFLPTLTYRSRFSATQHDGASAIRDYVYDDPCGCFRFPDSKLYAI